MAPVCPVDLQVIDFIAADASSRLGGDGNTVHVVLIRTFSFTFLFDVEFRELEVEGVV
jgi:hypothetical protein